MKYTPKQSEYIDSVDGNAHQSAVEIIGQLEARAAELEAMLIEYALKSVNSIITVLEK